VQGDGEKAKKDRATKGQLLRDANGLRHISRKLACVEDDHDLWIAYEVGDTTLSKLLCTITSEDDDDGGPPDCIIWHEELYKAIK